MARRRRLAFVALAVSRTFRRSAGGPARIEAYTWNALFAPAGLAKPILSKVHGAATLGYEVVGGTPEELDAHVRKEIAKWGPVVTASGAKPEQ